MEESGVKPLASHPPPPPPPVHGKPSKPREEGELTSSDEDALPACSTAPSVSTSDPAFPSKITSSLGGKSSIQGVKSGKSISANSKSGSTDIQSRASMHIGTTKGFPKHQGPFKLSNPRWHRPHGGSNLVISFSDDDSGSDTEQQGPREECETVSSLQAVSRNKQQSTSALIMETIQRTTSNEGKMQPKKVSISQAFAPSAPRSSIPKPRNMWSSSIEQRSRSTNSKPVSRNLSRRDGGRSKSVDLSDSKLQDLRQQIALRENELKLKTMQQSKEILSEPRKEFNYVNQNNTAPRRSRDISSDLHHEPKEPDRKRKRLALDGSGQLCRVFQEKASMNLLPSKEPAAKCNNPQDASLVDCGHHDGEIARSELLQGSTKMHMPDDQCQHLLANPNSKGQDGPGFSASCSLSDWMSRSRPNMVLSDPKGNMSLLNLPNTSGVESVKQSSRLDGNDPSSSLRKHATPSDDKNKSSDQQDALSKPGRYKNENSLQLHSIQASPNDENASIHHHGLTNQGFDDVDLQSLFEFEELHDKQLEEAQEHRRKCEIEERNALKTYLKAQRALAEANAQCSYLYRRRELFSFRLRSLLMDNPSLLLSSQQQGQFVDLWNFSNNVSEVNLDVPSSSDHIHAELDNGNQVGYESNGQSADCDLQQRFSPNVDGNNFGSEACSEPDASTSELLPHKNKETANAVLFPSNEPNVLSDECEDMYSFQGKKDIVGDSATKFSVDGPQESILLEAHLRSKLVSRLGTITSLRRNGIDGKSEGRVEQLPGADTSNGTQMALDKVPSHEPGKGQFHEQGSASGDQREVAVEGLAKDDEGRAKVQSLMDSDLHCDVTKNQSPDLGGFEGAEQNMHTFQDAEHSLSHYADRTTDLEDCRFQLTEGNQCAFLSSTFRSALYQVKSEYSVGAEYSVGSDHVHNMNQKDGICCPGTDKTIDFTEESVTNALVGGTESYTCNSLIDPLWPLCMYELRGKCNNEECPWQHFRDYSKSNLQKPRSSNSADAITGSSSNCSSQKVGELSHVLTPPAYLVCLGSLNDDSRSYDYNLARKCGPCWQKAFTVSLAVSSFIQWLLPSHEPVLHGSYGCIESRGNQNRQSLYFQNRNETMNLLQADLADGTQVVETALLILNQEIDKAVGIRKSLKLLARSLEGDPTSLPLWVVYLLIYYSDKISIGDDEWFSCAVKHNEGSYELWLMYINSCRKLKDKFAAYDTALSSLCRNVHACDGDAVHSSACILDLFLQMLHCFCISGSVQTVVKRIYRLLDAGQDPDSLLLSDVLQCLRISDKCVFWICCVYLVVYRKLPDVIVGMFEFEKDISLIDWPCLHLTTEDKQPAYKLMEMAAVSVKSHLDNICPENKTTALRAAHFLALNHVKLVAAVDSFEGCKGILQKYINQYSSSLEVVLLAARLRSQKGEGISFLGFEEALSNWPKEVPGIQCIWNQFAEYVLQDGRCDMAKDIMCRWYESVWKIQCSQNRFANYYDDGEDDKEGDMDPFLMLSLDSSECKPGNMDVVYGLLNLSLYRLLHKDIVKAHLALDKAMKTAHEDFRHCVREHAIFLLNYGPQLGKDGSLGGLLDILKSYIVHSNKFPVSEPLTRKFIQEVQKPRVKQLVHDMFWPMSPDFSVVNLVLETWFGPSLLPQKFNKMKELVDFVEAILEMSPGNYPLAISTCKVLLSREIDSASTSFWASSLLVNTVYQSVPVPPEYVWVEAAGLLSKLTSIEEIAETFHRKALSVYPFSVNLWKSFLKQSIGADSGRCVTEAAKEKGIELLLTSLEQQGVEAAKDKGIEIPLGIVGTEGVESAKEKV